MRLPCKRFDFADGKLTYAADSKDAYEYWTKGTQPPCINGTFVNLNPPKTFDSPFTSMVYGGSKAVITYPGHKNVVLDFNIGTKADRKAADAAQ